MTERTSFGMIVDHSEDDVDCSAWIQPEIALRDLPRMPIDRQGLRAAAETIVRYEEPHVVKAALASGDPRLKPYLVDAIAQRKERSA